MPDCCWDAPAWRAYMRREHDPEERHRMQAHLTACDVCRQKLADVLEQDWRETALLLADGTGLREGSAAHAPRRPRAVWRAWWRRPVWRIIVFCAALAVCAGVLFVVAAR